MDESHLLAAARYIALNPVRANLVNKPDDYMWSSVRAHLSGRDDILVSVEPLSSLVDNWNEFLAKDVPEEETKTIQSHERTGRPIGSEQFLKAVEKTTGRKLRKQKPGPRKNN